MKRAEGAKLTFLHFLQCKFGIGWGKIHSRICKGWWAEWQVERVMSIGFAFFFDEKALHTYPLPREKRATGGGKPQEDLSSV